jgi:hypothetical protein
LLEEGVGRAATAAAKAARKKNLTWNADISDAG